MFLEIEPQTAKKSLSDQKHLQYQERINLGSYYTPAQVVEAVHQMIAPHINERSVVLDSSCGYGAFLQNINVKRIIGNDIDKTAVGIVQNRAPHLEIYQHNALHEVNRHQFNIADDESLIIIGNPPYNDTTSIIRSGIKEKLFDVDADIETRDLGMSFLLSYAKLKADIVCVLHPLSYLIKESNYKSIRKFSNQYRLFDSLIISSSVFSDNSKITAFPIVIALYKKDNRGMSYSEICDFSFKTSSARILRVNDFEPIRKYINKYPTKNHNPQKDDIYFWTMRDLNALKRNQTFMNRYNENSIVVDKEKLDYYVYVDTIRDYFKKFPYYFGNLDVVINQELFKKYKKYFIGYGCRKYKFINDYYDINIDDCEMKINEYLKILLGGHYEY